MCNFQLRLSIIQLSCRVRIDRSNFAQFSLHVDLGMWKFRFRAFIRQFVKRIFYMRIIESIVHRFRFTKWKNKLSPFVQSYQLTRSQPRHLMTSDELSHICANGTNAKNRTLKSTYIIFMQIAATRCLHIAKKYVLYSRNSRSSTRFRNIPNCNDSKMQSTIRQKKNNIDESLRWRVSEPFSQSSSFWANNRRIGAHRQARSHIIFIIRGWFLRPRTHPVVQAAGCVCLR